jgi:hypothetical protein
MTAMISPEPFAIAASANSKMKLRTIRVAV